MVKKNVSDWQGKNGIRVGQRQYLFLVQPCENQVLNN